MTVDRTDPHGAADTSAGAHGAADTSAGDAADTSGDDAARAAEARRAEARRRRRVDEVFGDVLPATTRDERDPGRRSGFSLEHYRASKPPHWGDKQ